MSQLEAISNIDSEIGLLEEVRDIQDELRMILRILDDQAIVRTGFTELMDEHRQGVEPQTTQSLVMHRSMPEPNVLFGAKSNCLTVRPMTTTEDGGVVEGVKNGFQSLIQTLGTSGSCLKMQARSMTRYGMLVRACRSTLTLKAPPSPGPEAEASKYHGSKICT